MQTKFSLELSSGCYAWDFSVLSYGKQANPIVGRVEQYGDERMSPAKMLVPREAGSKVGNPAGQWVFGLDLSCPLFA